MADKITITVEMGGEKHEVDFNNATAESVTVKRVLAAVGAQGIATDFAGRRLGLDDPAPQNIRVTPDKSAQARRQR